MGKKGTISSASEVLRDGTSKEEGVDLVVDFIGFVLIEGEQDEGSVVIEGWKGQEGNEPEFKPIRGKVDVGVVSVVDDVGCDEGPLRDRRSVDIGGEVVEVAYQRTTFGDVSDRVVDGERIVFPKIERVRSGGGLEVVCLRESESKPPISRYVLLICSPRDLLRLKQVDDGGDVWWDVVEIVVSHSEEITTNRSNIIGF